MKKEENTKMTSKELMSLAIKQGKLACSVLSESETFNNKDIIQTDLPVLNIALSGDIDGGFVSGLAILAGESKSYKTLLGLYCMKAYLNKYDDAIAFLYDNEFGVTPEYLQINGIDPTRVLHIPMETIEGLTKDFTERLKVMTREQKIFVLIDSIGSLASAKELENALSDNSSKDMTRAQALKSFFRIVTPQITLKDVPCFAINHTYKTMEMFSKTVVSGGSGIIYSSNFIFIISKTPEKNKAGEIEGYKFTITIEKSRLVKEKSKIPFYVYWDAGIDKYSGLFDLAIEAGMILQSGSWYQLVDLETGEILDKKIHKTDIPEEFFDNLISNEQFKNYIKNTYKIQAK